MSSFLGTNHCCGGQSKQRSRIAYPWAASVLQALVLASSAVICCWGLPRVEGPPCPMIRLCRHTGSFLLREREGAFLHVLRGGGDSSAEEGVVLSCGGTAPTVEVASQGCRSGGVKGAVAACSGKEEGDEKSTAPAANTARSSAADSPKRKGVDGKSRARSAGNGRAKTPVNAEKFAPARRASEDTLAASQAVESQRSRRQEQESLSEGKKPARQQPQLQQNEQQSFVGNGSPQKLARPAAPDTQFRMARQQDEHRALGQDLDSLPSMHTGTSQQTAQASLRYWYDKKEKVWCLKRAENEDLSVESLHGYWSFPDADCLTYRFRRPDRWGSEPWAPGLLGWLEFFVYLTPGLNIVMKYIRGLWPCAVCGLRREKHPFRSIREAEGAFWEAVRDRDIELAVRLVRGGVDCSPGGGTWCLLAFIMANYCQDPYRGVKPAREDLRLSSGHLTAKSKEFHTYFSTTMPFL